MTINDIARRLEAAGHKGVRTFHYRPSCPDCGGTGRCPPRTSGRRPADECNTCRGTGRVNR